MEISRDLLNSTVAGTSMVQNLLQWLSINPNRYLRIILNAAEPTITQAGQRLQKIVFNGDTYETIVITSGRDPVVWGAGMDTVLETIDQGTTSVELYNIVWP